VRLDEKIGVAIRSISPCCAAAYKRFVSADNVELLKGDHHMKFLVLLTPVAGREPAEFKPYAVAEMQAVWNDYKAGTLREIYFSSSPLIISVIYETSSRDELEQSVARLPMVEVGLLSFQIIELGPMHSFEVLFAPAAA